MKETGNGKITVIGIGPGGADGSVSHPDTDIRPVFMEPNITISLLLALVNIECY